MDTSETVRKDPRFNVGWPILYIGDDFVAEGTIVDLSLDGGRFAGTMPVAVGMHLALFMDSPQKDEDLIIEDAVVMWVREHEFGAQFRKIRTDNQQWLRGYLETAERRHSFRRMSGLATDSSEVARVPLALSLKG